ncbi:anti-sigma F factor [Oceanobacillus iheyensis]|uniref:Anti-sigma F factor n=1 Tax=Oceanobacillus iheyensis (strain DSM 14371 / CIP 107618 / JCM 11309 / KCTC 3954 / HTE831) TaxID=221109 RepID=SP2AB_OCEIH|nr:anti-sigma F factor [Oceanobacillus iheyensis]Q8EQ73.1 RecName: Full=Anti-sigma F factor; AltName: Full=Stage II sporulation protein AB [Oceanobacillus iheyensis HTE831]BAC13796.1 stage II sporulation protein AB (anti-sigma F factor) [Oceanobacillus iheyensis HTE831]
MKNEMSLAFASVSENEAFARVAVASFITQLDPTMDELTEIKTVVSEAVTNSIIHGYHNEPHHKVYIECVLQDDEIEITIRDEGVGIKDIDEAREPLYTSKPELERSGMGFTIIENFMDSVEVISAPEKGTSVYMTKQLSKSKTVYN